WWGRFPFDAHQRQGELHERTSTDEIFRPALTIRVDPLARRPARSSRRAIGDVAGDGDPGRRPYRPRRAAARRQPEADSTGRARRAHPLSRTRTLPGPRAVHIEWLSRRSLLSRYEPAASQARRPLRSCRVPRRAASAVAARADARSGGRALRGVRGAPAQAG